MKPKGEEVVATNRQARRNFAITETFEAGIVLRGSEVKSLRESKVQLSDSWASIEGGEAWLHNLHIAPYTMAQSHSGHEPLRDRKLLMHRHEIDRLRMTMQLERVSLVPLKLYFKDGKLKVELGLGKGRTTVDRRQDIAKRDAERETRREIGRAMKQGY